MIIIRFFLPTGSIDRIDPYITNIKVHFFIIILNFGYFNILKRILYVKKSAFDQ